MNAEERSGNAVSEALAKIGTTYETEKEKNLVTEAYFYAQKMHAEQKRASGEPYFVHPCSVANILMDMFVSSYLIILTAGEVNYR